jgi:hypothetical protein
VPFDRGENRIIGIVAASSAEWQPEFIYCDRGGADMLARLDPAHPPSDVSPMRWLRFIDNCGRFLDEGWAARADALGWEPLVFQVIDARRNTRILPTIEF